VTSIGCRCTRTRIRPLETSIASFVSLIRTGHSGASFIFDGVGLIRFKLPARIEAYARDIRRDERDGKSRAIRQVICAHSVRSTDLTLRLVRHAACHVTVAQDQYRC
jgi:hypothetical protein